MYWYKVGRAREGTHGARRTQVQSTGGEAVKQGQRTQMPSSALYSQGSMWAGSDAPARTACIACITCILCITCVACTTCLREGSNTPLASPASPAAPAAPAAPACARVSPSSSLHPVLVPCRAAGILPPWQPSHRALCRACPGCCSKWGRCLGCTPCGVRCTSVPGLLASPRRRWCTCCSCARRQGTLCGRTALARHHSEKGCAAVIERGGATGRRGATAQSLIACLVPTQICSLKGGSAPPPVAVAVVRCQVSGLMAVVHCRGLSEQGWHWVTLGHALYYMTLQALCFWTFSGSRACPAAVVQAWRSFGMAGVHVMGCAASSCFRPVVCAAG